MECSETKRYINFQKYFRTADIFNILISKYLSRYNGVYFFGIWTFKSDAIM